MTDLEQELFDMGFQNDDDEQSGDFSQEGFETFKWRAKVVVPKTDGVPPEQLLGALFNLPLGGGGDSGGLGSLFTGAAGGAAAAAAGGGDASSALSAMGPAAGLISGQFNQMIQSIAQSVREVRLTVLWRSGTQVESIDLVTHVVSLGPGSDKNGGGPQTADPLAAAAAAAAAAAGGPGGPGIGTGTGGMPGLPGFPGFPGSPGGKAPGFERPPGAPTGRLRP
jgi:general secretion pathway protein I